MQVHFIEVIPYGFTMSIQSLSTTQLKQMWDDWEDFLDNESLSDLPFHYEEIHAELNRRGEGLYCAV